MGVYDTTSAAVTLTKISPVWPTGPMMGYASSTGTHQTCAARFRLGGPAMKRSGKWSLRNRLAAACACSAVIVGVIVVAIEPFLYDSLIRIRALCPFILSTPRTIVLSYSRDASGASV